MNDVEEPFWRRPPFIAAVAAVLLAAGGVAWWLTRDDLYSTPVGGLQRVVLSDYSLLELNSDTAALVKYRGSLRTIELLHGEAAFRVSRDPKRPFVAIAGNAAVRAASGRFTLRRLPSGIEVLVFQDTVAVGSMFDLARPGSWIPPSTAHVDAGYLASYGAGEFKLQRVSDEEIDRRLQWKGGNPNMQTGPRAR